MNNEEMRMWTKYIQMYQERFHIQSSALCITDTSDADRSYACDEFKAEIWAVIW